MTHDDGGPMADLSPSDGDVGREVSPWLAIGGVLLVLVGLAVLAWLLT